MSLEDENLREWWVTLAAHRRAFSITKPFANKSEV